MKNRGNLAMVSPEQITSERRTISLFDASGFDKCNQFVRIGKVIVVPRNPRTMINDPAFLVSFKAIQQCRDAVLASVTRKGIRFNLLQQPFPAFRFRTFVTTVQTLFLRAIPVFAPVLIRTISAVASPAAFVFATQAAGQPATRNPQFPIHRNIPLQCKHSFFHSYFDLSAVHSFPWIKISRASRRTLDIQIEIRYTCTRVPKGHGVMVTRGSPKPLLRVRVLLPLPLWVALIRSGGSLFCFYISTSTEMMTTAMLMRCLRNPVALTNRKKILSRINFWVDFMKHVCYTFSRWFFC